MLRGSVDGGQALARTRSVVGRVWGRSISRRAGSAAYFPFSAALQRPTDSGSAAATTRLAVRPAPASDATSGRDTPLRRGAAAAPRRGVGGRDDAARDPPAADIERDVRPRHRLAIPAGA